MFTRKFWQDALERAAKTAAQAAILKLGIDEASGGFDVLNADWTAVGSFAAGGVVLSVLFSIVSSKRGNPSEAGFHKGVKSDLSDGSLEFGSEGDPQH